MKRPCGGTPKPPAPRTSPNKAAELERLERERPPAGDGPAVQDLSADGAMVPLVGGEWAEVKTLAIGAVEVRPGEDGLPDAQTTDLTYFSRLADAETFTRQAYVDTHRRGTDTVKVVRAVQDGAEWEQGLVDVLRADAVRILDFPHAIEQLTAAAQPVLGIGTPEFKAWLDEQAHTLKHATDGARRCSLRRQSCQSSARLIQWPRHKHGIIR